MLHVFKKLYPIPWHNNILCIWRSHLQYSTTHRNLALLSSPLWTRNLEDYRCPNLSDNQMMTRVPGFHLELRLMSTDKRANICIIKPLSCRPKTAHLISRETRKLAVILHLWIMLWWNEFGTVLLFCLFSSCAWRRFHTNTNMKGYSLKVDSVPAEVFSPDTLSHPLCPWHPFLVISSAFYSPAHFTILLWFVLFCLLFPTLRKECFQYTQSCLTSPSR